MSGSFKLGFIFVLLIMMFNQATCPRKCWTDDVAEAEKYDLNDLAKKKNINELKNILVTYCGIEAFTEELAVITQSIIDWVDEDQLYSIPGVGAEDDWYEAHNQGYECKDALFESIDELSLIRGLRIEEGDSEEEIERKKNILDTFKEHVYIPTKDSEAPKDDEQSLPTEDSGAPKDDEQSSLSGSGCFINNSFFGSQFFVIKSFFEKSCNINISNRSRAMISVLFRTQ